MQDGKRRLLGYASKSLPDACKNSLLGQIPQCLYKPQLDPGEYHTLYLSKPLLDILLVTSLA